jgi:putative FmdB family regulatory protein
MDAAVLFNLKIEVVMPIYTYYCDQHGEFEELKSISDRLIASCPLCGMVCQHTIQTNEFAAKTRYIPPPAASRKFGEENRTPHRRKKWV